MFEALAINLENQVATHTTLYDLVTLECMLDHQTDLTELKRLETEKIICMRHAHELELERQGLTESLTHELGLDKGIKLEELAKLASTEIQARLLHCKGLLLELAPQIQKTARKAAEKMQARANCYREMNEGMHKRFTRTTLYSKAGKIKSPQGSLLMNRSV